jgi:hypothetical protein
LELASLVGKLQHTAEVVRGGQQLLREPYIARDEFVGDEDAADGPVGEAHAGAGAHGRGGRHGHLLQAPAGCVQTVLPGRRTRGDRFLPRGDDEDPRVHGRAQRGARRHSGLHDGRQRDRWGGTFPPRALRALLPSRVVRPGEELELPRVRDRLAGLQEVRSGSRLGGGARAVENGQHDQPQHSEQAGDNVGRARAHQQGAQRPVSRTSSGPGSHAHSGSGQRVGGQALAPRVELRQQRLAPGRAHLLVHHGTVGLRLQPGRRSRHRGEQLLPPGVLLAHRELL